MLTIDSLRLQIGTAEILRGISLEVGKGEALGLVGESGSGKSMTMRCIVRSLPAAARVTGSIRLAGEDVLALRGEELRRMRAHRTAMIAQNPHAALNPVLPVQRFLLEGMREARGGPLDESIRKARALLDQVGIADVDRCLKSYPHQLSGGMLQRVAIAGAVSGNPQLMLADEPTTALDVTTQAEVMALLDGMRRELHMSMIFVTHDLDLAAAVCDRIAVMKDGEIVETATPADLYDRPQAAYTRQLMSARPSIDARKERQQ
ncbi:ABC transporter ATP-binding protein [Saxibacter everestensis]|uniref:ABC transporter ATP-binding protein n=1 Tax=Saxibacter everestensis TaxID=2909229 RepID=A0ABY8QTB1_9MICO|nr:ABC transporter ATP-binding protein [Brevibacteriaceae bacterium ZFBP1038]